MSASRRGEKSGNELLKRVPDGLEPEQSSRSVAIPFLRRDPHRAIEAGVAGLNFVGMQLAASRADGFERSGRAHRDFTLNGSTEQGGA